MSRFKIGEEITVRWSQGSVTRGKFYMVTHIETYGDACILDDESDVCAISDGFGLTREEYEQAEREKDPFAPGKWVVCVERYRHLKKGSVIQVHAEHAADPQDWFVVDIEGIPWGMRKSRFRPATPEEVKQQEQKVMNETKDDSSVTDRQTFTVGGKEFYVGQRVWVTNEELFFTSGTQLEVIGLVHNAPLTICVREPSSSMIYFIGYAAVTTTKPKPHEWKFGDWARYNETGDVVFVISWEPLTDTVVVVRDEKTSGNAPVFMETKTLTYISTAEIPA